MIGNDFARLVRRAKQRLGWWAHDRRLVRDLGELGAHERGLALAEFGLMEHELSLIAGRRAREGGQWKTMMARLGLDPAKAEKEEGARDLSRTCALCDAKGRCRRWCAAPPPHEGFRAFCANALTFELMLKRQPPA